MASILLVEDDPDDAELALMALRRIGIDSVEVARDGVEALARVFERTDLERPALILLDLKLPKVGGLEVLERLKSDPESRSIPVVVLSSSGEDRDIDASYRLGANSYIRKRVDFEEHAEAMRLVGDYWLSLNE